LLSTPRIRLVGILLTGCSLAGWGGVGCADGPVGDDDDSAEPAAPFSLVDLELIDHPDNVLSTFVRWTTDVPASSRVEFGEGGEYRFFVEEPELVVEHELFVFGLHPKSAYQLRAISRDAAGAEVASGAQQLLTAALPFDPAAFHVVTHDPERIQPGWTLLNAMVGQIVAPTIAMMIDDQGKPVWYHELEGAPTFGDVEVTLVDGEHVLIGGCVPPSTHPVLVDLRGEVVWQGPQQAAQAYGQGAMHHTFQRLPSGDFVTLTYDLQDGVMIDVIEQFDADLQPRWSWHAGDHLSEATEMHLHGNMVSVDEDLDVAYFHAHQLGQLFQIDRGDGSVRWTFGEGGDFTVLSDPQHPWPQYAHAPEFLENGNLLLHDNGDGDSRGFTRAVEYAIDEQAMTAELVWEYPGEADDFWYNYAWGDADRLDNGNTLIVSGSMIPWDSQSRLLEVTPEGEVVWEVWMGTPDGGLAGAYMAQRVPVLVGEIGG